MSDESMPELWRKCRWENMAISDGTGPTNVTQYAPAAFWINADPALDPTIQSRVLRMAHGKHEMAEGASIFCGTLSLADAIERGDLRLTFDEVG